eukprot:Pompholyxophrys_punicea_v1_NODE_519_length_1784_cov_2.994795.p2 type:complete len:101 gc:universal NODE_519_length_1784_cov_2.994795:970-1272(+)
MRLSDLNALTFFVLAKMTQSGYQEMRNADPNCNFLPCEHIQAAKKECLPANLKVDSAGNAKIPVQDLCDHTFKRFRAAISVLPAQENDYYKLVWKWGFDG